MQKKGIALSALIVGIAAFVIGWVPVVGLIAGAAAVTLGIIGLVKKQPKWFNLTGIILGALAAITSVVMIFVIAFTASSIVDTANDEPAPVVAEEPEGTEIPDLVGMPGDEADDQLFDLGFLTEFDAGEETVIMRSNWIVTGTTPAAGEFAEEGSTVVIHVEKEEPEPSQTPATESTTLGLTGTYAWSACTQAGEAMFPYGFRIHLTGVLADAPQDEEWFLKATITTENEFGNKRKDQVMECYVTGTNEAPQISDFLVY